ncbi:Iduronate 2-sulfatase [Armadillidium nasatum]|uniref:Iduronate 2-sulfatase n=1 Tax=Armadillidium nasatum TaxID=96803 RepID=A0A5N5SU76_9CRUS|nr:Iduronate 2-sulfatase [Armadillidium nasatum]
MFQIFLLLFVSTVVFSDNLETDSCDGLPKPNVLLLIVDDLRPTINSFGDSFAITPNIDEIAQNGVIFTKAFSQVEEQPEGTLPDIQSTNFALNWLRKRYEKSVNFIKVQNKPFLLAVGFHKPHIPLKFPQEFLNLYPLEKVPLPSNRFRPKGLPLVAWNPWNDLRRRDDISSLNVSFPFGPIPDFYSKYIRQGYYAATSYTDSLIGPIVALTKQLFPNTIIVFMADHGWSLGEHQEWSKFSNYDVATKVPLIISLPSKKWFSSQNMIKTLKEIERKSISSSYFKKFVQRFKMNVSNSRNFTYKRQQRFNDVTELLDVFPTLVDLAGLSALPKCPPNSFNTSLCTEGESLYCILNKKVSRKSETKKIPDCPRKTTAYSQYPRPGVHPTVKPDSDQPRLNETKIMGYSVRTKRFRYTSWIKFNHTTFDVDFSKVYGEELYDHKYDDEENVNLIPFRKRLLARMRKLLRIIFK